MASEPDLSGADLDAWFVEAVDRLARGTHHDLDAHLVSVGADSCLTKTKTTCRVHFVARDGNGRPLLKGLAKKLAQQAIDYCIPRSRLDEARQHFDRTGSTEQFVQLNEEARALFTASEKTGEPGEMLLFLLLERLLGIPQLLCKMSLKTSSQMHFHGTDGVHVKALDGERIALYWCESKLYASAHAAIDACFTSIAPYLLDDGDGASQRDLMLVRDNIDTGDPELNRRLVEFFLSDSPSSGLREIRGASLVGFSLEDYPVPTEADGVTVVAEVVQAITDWQERIASRVLKEKIEQFTIEVFCLPMPSVEDFRTALRDELGLS